MAERKRSLNEAAKEAVNKSYLSTIPDAILRQLLTDAVRLDAPAGSLLYRETDDARIGLVVAGLLRVYLTSPDGRQVTVRYARPGDVLGTAVTVGGPVAVSVQALIESSIVQFNVRTIQVLAAKDARLAWAIAAEVTRRLYAVLDELAGNAFNTVRQRVARHLLDMAAQHQNGTVLVAPVSQQELADAVGSVREVVARILRDFRRQQLVDTGSDGIILLKPELLSSKAGIRDTE